MKTETRDKRRLRLLPSEEAGRGDLSSSSRRRSDKTANGRNTDSTTTTTDRPPSSPLHIAH